MSWQALEVSWITRKISGPVTTSGLYVEMVNDDHISGSRRVPNYEQEGKFDLELQS